MRRFSTTRTSIRYEQKELCSRQVKSCSNISSAFSIQTYTEVAQAGNLNIGYRNEIDFLLKYCLLEKAVYELGYELNSRPRWAVIPLTGIASIMEFNNSHMIATRYAQKPINSGKCWAWRSGLQWSLEAPLVPEF